MRPQAARSRSRTILRRTLFGAGALLLAALLGGCLVPPQPATTQAKDVFTLYNIILVMGAVVFLGVEGMIVYSVIRYRRRDDQLPRQVHGNTLVEILWTAIPTVIVLVLFILSIGTLNTIQAKSSNPLTIEVDAFQWQWTFRYLDAGYTVTGTQDTPPVMGLPTNTPIRLILKSNDVIHSFYVPHFLIKRDVIPFPAGQPLNELEFTVSDPGTYPGQCAEFCGQLHARMTFSVEAMAPAKFQAWLASAKAGKPQPTAVPGATVIKLSAKNLQFSTTRLEVPAGKPFVIEFENQDTVPHNVNILQAGKSLFKGDIVSGPKTIRYNVQALAAGEYDFICDVHPTVMVGKLVAK